MTNGVFLTLLVLSAVVPWALVMGAVYGKPVLLYAARVARDRKLAKQPEPDVRLYQKKDEKHLYMIRWWLIPRNAIFNIYLHHFIDDDGDEVMHDHPWWNMSFLFEGEYLEHTPQGDYRRKQGQIFFRTGSSRHRIDLFHEDVTNLGRIPRQAWTIFITGPKYRSWGFWCDQGKRFVPWRTFSGSDHNKTGRGTVGIGCGEE